MITKRQLHQILRTEGYTNGEYPPKVMADRRVQKYQRGYAMYGAFDTRGAKAYLPWLIDILLVYQYMQHNKLWLGEP